MFAWLAMHNVSPAQGTLLPIVHLAAAQIIYINQHALKPAQPATSPNSLHAFAPNAT